MFLLLLVLLNPVSIPDNLPRECATNLLACNIYFEARAEPIKGRFGVGFVTINRVKHQLFIEDSIHQTILAKKQFSWVTAKNLKILEKDLWEEAKLIAFTLKLLSKNNKVYRLLDFTKGSVYFHHKDLNITRNGYPMTIGNHTFVRLEK